MQMGRFKIKSSRINHIFISHLHGDHYLGLPGFIASLHLKNRNQELHLYCHEPLREILEVQFRHSQTHLRFPIQYHFLNPDKEELIYDDHSLQVVSFPLNHRIPCNGFLFKEKTKPLPVRKDMIARYSIPPQEIPRIKQGADFIEENGNVIPNSQLTHPPLHAASYAYCSDTIYQSSLAKILKGVDLLYHEATFLDEHRHRAKETYHTTARQAALFAKEAGVGRLLMGHFSARYHNLEAFVTEAGELFPESILAQEGSTYKVFGK